MAPCKTSLPGSQGAADDDDDDDDDDGDADDVVRL